MLSLPKLVLLVLIIAIVASLTSGLYFMMKNNDDSDQMVKALTIRVVLSLLLFGTLMLGYHLEWFQPNTTLPY